MHVNEVFQTYLALKAHFNSDYDYFLYNGNIKTSKLETRRDRRFFFPLANKPDPFGLILACLVHNPKTSVAFIVSEDAQRIFMNHSKRLQSLSYIFKEDLKKLKDEYTDNFVCAKNQHPFLLKQFFGQKIGIETLLIITELSDCKSYWKRQLRRDTLWKELSIRLNKYRPFVEYDKEKFSTLIIDHFSLASKSDICYNGNSIEKI